MNCELFVNCDLLGKILNDPFMILVVFTGTYVISLTLYGIFKLTFRKDSK